MSSKQTLNPKNFFDNHLACEDRKKLFVAHMNGLCTTDEIHPTQHSLLGSVLIDVQHNKARRLNSYQQKIGTNFSTEELVGALTKRSDELMDIVFEKAKEISYGVFAWAGAANAAFFQEMEVLLYYIWDTLTSAKRGVQKALSGALKKLGEYVLSFFGWLTEAFKKTSTLVKKTLGAVLSFLSELLPESVAVTVRHVTGMIGANLSKVVQWLRKIITTLRFRQCTLSVWCTHQVKVLVYSAASLASNKKVELRGKLYQTMLRLMLRVGQYHRVHGMSEAISPSEQLTKFLEKQDTLLLEDVAKVMEAYVEEELTKEVLAADVMLNSNITREMLKDLNRVAPEEAPQNDGDLIKFALRLLRAQFEGASDQRHFAVSKLIEVIERPVKHMQDVTTIRYGCDSTEMNSFRSDKETNRYFEPSDVGVEQPEDYSSLEKRLERVKQVYVPEFCNESDEVDEKITNVEESIEAVQYYTKRSTNDLFRKAYKKEVELEEMQTLGYFAAYVSQLERMLEEMVYYSSLSNKLSDETLEESILKTYKEVKRREVQFLISSGDACIANIVATNQMSILEERLDEWVSDPKSSPSYRRFSDEEAVVIDAEEAETAQQDIGAKTGSAQSTTREPNSPSGADSSGNSSYASSGRRRRQRIVRKVLSVTKDQYGQYIFVDQNNNVVSDPPLTQPEIDERIENYEREQAELERKRLLQIVSSPSVTSLAKKSTVQRDLSVSSVPDKEYVIAINKERETLPATAQKIFELVIREGHDPVTIASYFRTTQAKAREFQARGAYIMKMHDSVFTNNELWMMHEFTKTYSGFETETTKQEVNESRARILKAFEENLEEALRKTVDSRDTDEYEKLKNFSRVYKAKESSSERLDYIYSQEMEELGNEGRMFSLFSSTEGSESATRFASSSDLTALDMLRKTSWQLKLLEQLQNAIGKWKRDVKDEEQFKNPLVLEINGIPMNLSVREVSEIATLNLPKDSTEWTSVRKMRDTLTILSEGMKAEHSKLKIIFSKLAPYLAELNHLRLRRKLHNSAYKAALATFIVVATGSLVLLEAGLDGIIGWIHSGLSYVGLAKDSTLPVDERTAFDIALSQTELIKTGGAFAEEIEKARVLGWMKNDPYEQFSGDTEALHKALLRDHANGLIDYGGALKDVGDIYTQRQLDDLALSTTDPAYSFLKAQVRFCESLQREITGLHGQQLEANSKLASYLSNDYDPKLGTERMYNPHDMTLWDIILEKYKDIMYAKEGMEQEGGANKAVIEDLQEMLRTVKEQAEEEGISNVEAEKMVEFQISVMKRKVEISQMEGWTGEYILSLFGTFGSNVKNALTAAKTAVYKDGDFTGTPDVFKRAPYEKIASKYRNNGESVLFEMIGLVCSSHGFLLSSIYAFGWIFTTAVPRAIAAGVTAASSLYYVRTRSEVSKLNAQLSQVAPQSKQALFFDKHFNAYKVGLSLVVDTVLVSALTGAAALIFNLINIAMSNAGTFAVIYGSTGFITSIPAVAVLTAIITGGTKVRFFPNSGLLEKAKQDLFSDPYNAPSSFVDYLRVINGDLFSDAETVLLKKIDQLTIILRAYAKEQTAVIESFTAEQDLMISKAEEIANTLSELKRINASYDEEKTLLEEEFRKKYKREEKARTKVIGEHEVNLAQLDQKHQKKVKKVTKKLQGESADLISYTTPNLRSSVRIEDVSSINLPAAAASPSTPIRTPTIPRTPARRTPSSRTPVLPTSGSETTSESSVVTTPSGRSRRILRRTISPDVVKELFPEKEEQSEEE